MKHLIALAIIAVICVGIAWPTFGLFMCGFVLAVALYGLVYSIVDLILM